MPIQFPRRNRDASHLLPLHESVRDGAGCPRHRFLSGQRLQASLTACSSGCSHFMGAVYHRVSRRVAVVLLFVLTLVHPLLHQFEGGALDAFLAMLTVRAFTDE